MTENEIHFRNTDDCIKKIKSIRTMYRDTTPSYVALSDAIQALEEIQQCREYKKIFESHFSEEALKLLSNKEEFGKWLERGRWIAKKCDEINRELEQYRAIGTIEEFKALKEYKAKMEMQYLDDINNPLEPLKLSSALQSEIHKYNYRKEHKPQDISPLDYTIIYALKHCLEEQMTET